MAKRIYISPQIEIAQADPSEILVIIGESETDIQWAPRHNYEEDSFVYEEYEDYGIRSFGDRNGYIWE